MRLQKVQDALEKKNIKYEYTEEDGCGSLDFMFRGLKFHVWEYHLNKEDIMMESGGQRPIFMRLEEARILKEIMKRRFQRRSFPGRI